MSENRMALLPAECFYTTTYISALECDGENTFGTFFVFNPNSLKLDLLLPP